MDDIIRCRLLILTHTQHGYRSDRLYLSAFLKFLFYLFSFSPELLTYTALPFNVWLGVFSLPLKSKLSVFYSCQVQRCSVLSAPEHAWISPWFCSTERPIYGRSCKVGCHTGFREISGVDQFLCGSNGEWSNDTSTILECEGKLPLRTDKAQPLNS